MEMNDASMGKKEKGPRKREEVDDGKREREREASSRVAGRSGEARFAWETGASTHAFLGFELSGMYLRHGGLGTGRMNRYEGRRSP